MNLFHGPEGRPNNLPQPAWGLTELFFWSDLSWLWADLCTNSYVISTRFSLLSTMPSCTRYISNIGIKIGLNSFQDFPCIKTFLLRSISVFYLWKTERFWKELSPSETVIFGPCNFEKRSFSEILDQCDFGKNGVWQKNWIAYYLVKTLGPAWFRKEWSLTKKNRKNYYLIYLVQTPSWQIRTRKILERIDSTFKSYVWNS